MDRLISREDEINSATRHRDHNFIHFAEVLNQHLLKYEYPPPLRNMVDSCRSSPHVQSAFGCTQLSTARAMLYVVSAHLPPRTRKRSSQQSSEFMKIGYDAGINDPIKHDS